MVYDANRHEIVLFGGGLGPEPKDDTWTWDGSSWTEQLVNSKPPGRADASAAYDPVRKTVVMFGGKIDGAKTIDDLWEWDGTGWTDRTPMLSPVPRRGAGLAWDAARGRLVLVGGLVDPAGANGSGSGLAEDVWELERFADGSARWSIVEVENTLSARADFVMVSAIDGAGVTVLQGNLGNNVAADDVRTLRWDGSPSVETCTQANSDADGAIACADPDCWAICTPTCEPGVTCDVNGPTCGDGVASRIEDCATCPADHGPCPTVCGDFVCTPGEACLGDCPP